MALIECPECGSEVSDTAAACPKCAYRLGAGTPPPPPPAVKREWVIPALSIASRLSVGLSLFGLGIAEEQYTGMLGGLIVGGSAIPAFFRAWAARLKPARPDATLVDGLDARMVELEHRHGELEQRQLEQITDLDDRVEFAERLLTKQREQIGPS